MLGFFFFNYGNGLRFRRTCTSTINSEHSMLKIHDCLPVLESPFSLLIVCLRLNKGVFLKSNIQNIHLNTFVIKKHNKDLYFSQAIWPFSFPQCSIYTSVEGGCFAFTYLDGYRKQTHVKIEISLAPQLSISQNDKHNKDLYFSQAIWPFSFPQCSIYTSVEGGCFAFTYLDGYQKQIHVKIRDIIGTSTFHFTKW